MKKQFKKIIIIAIVLILLLFIIALGRKIFLYKTLMKKSKDWVNYDNYSITRIYKSNSLYEIRKTFYKDQKYVENSYSLSLEQDNKYSYGEYAECFDGTSLYCYYINENTIRITEAEVGKEYHPINQPISHFALLENDFFELIKYSFRTNISLSKCNGIKCYKINLFDNFEIYLDIETGLPIRMCQGLEDTSGYEDIVVDIKYEFNSVTDKDIIPPNYDSFEIIYE